MKRQMLTLIGVVALLLVGASAAQTVQVKAKVPFDFVVGGKTLPAGEYSIKSFGASDGRSLLIANANTKDRAIIQALAMESLRASANTKLVFHQYGDQYFLNQVWVAGATSGHEMPKSARESEVALDYSAQSVDLLAAAR